MKSKNLLVASLLAVLASFIGGCYYREVDHYRGYDGGRGSYRDGYRDGRVYENRRDNWRDDGYRHRYRRDPR